MPVTAVIGTGTWGTAAALLACRGADRRVMLYGRDPEKVATLAASRLNPLLPGVMLPEQLQITADLTQLSAADLILWAVPTQFSRAQARHLAPHLHRHASVVSLSKGLEHGTRLRVSEILAAELGERAYGCLSGPSHAMEVAAGLPCSLVIAGPDALCQTTVERLHSPRWRIYTSSDLLGVELGGALKNVIAVAAGICDGLKLGDNAKAAIMTRGLAEMRRLGRAMGANDATFAGLAGIGDLLTSCYSPLGRNRALGLAIARGENPQDFLAHSKMVAEGAWTCRAAVDLAERHQVELPIASQVAFAIWAATPVTQAMEKLLSRAPKEEDA